MRSFQFGVPAWRRPGGLRAGILAVVLALVIQPPSASAAASVVEEASAALRSDFVYVHPDARAAFSQDQEEEVRQRIAQAQAGPIYVAVLPDSARREAGGSARKLSRRIGNMVRQRGTYVVVVGGEIAALSTAVRDTAPDLAEEVNRSRAGEGPGPLVLDFVDRLDRVAEGGSEPGSEPSDSGGGLFGFGGVLALLLGGGFVAFVLSRRRKRQREQRELEEVRKVALEDLIALGEGVQALDMDLERPSANPAARQDYVRALECYERATKELDEARRPQDVQTVTATLDEGRYAIAAAEARLQGQEPPERRPPCFFDPRHGPSVRDVDWAPPRGALRRVPACAADAQRVEEGGEPDARQISVGGRRVPYWDAPPYYGGWAGGYFGGSGLFSGLLLGSMLSGGLGGGWGDHGGGDSQGGDFGGDDFGGGDFGGGDFG